MKKLVVATVLFLLSFSVGFGQATFASLNSPAKFRTLIGRWEIIGGQDQGGCLEIIDSSAIFIRFNGEEKRLLNYKIDFSKSPYWFDFSAKDSSSTITINSLFEFVNEDMLKWQVFMDEERTNHFSSSKGELFYLKRITSKSNSVYYTGNK